MGIIHTNYQFYARGEKHGVVKKPVVKAACAFTVRAHCHRIIKLSDALQGYAKEKEMVENVHGVSLILCVSLRVGRSGRGVLNCFGVVFFYIHVFFVDYFGGVSWVEGESYLVFNRFYVQI